MNNLINKRITRARQTQSGAAMLISIIFFLFISLAIIIGLASPVAREFKNSSNLINSKQSFFTSESGIEDAFYRLKTLKTINSPITLSVNGGTATTTVVDSGFNQKTITSSGDLLSRQRKNELKLSPGDGVSFNYGIQSGQGGFLMNNNSGVNGNVYSNGVITGSPGAYITGTAVSAGASGSISSITIGSGTTGDAWANSVTSSTIYGNLYCQSGSGNNKSCNTTRSAPPSTSMPVTQDMINSWEADAASGGILSGDLTISSATSLGPKEITGNLIINKDLTITGTVYVQGTISMSNGVHVSLSPSYGGTGGIIITDKPISLSNNVVFAGSGTANTYILLITTSSCPTTGCTSTNALEVANNVGAVILNAQSGTAHINNNVTLNAIVSNKIIMDNNVVIDYLTGLADQSFSSGPSGGWHVSSWQEIK